MKRGTKRQLKSILGRKAAWTVAGGLGAMAAGSLTLRLLEAGWRSALHEEPPTRTRKRPASWAATLAWTAGTAAVVGVASLLADHGSRHALTVATGRNEPKR